MTKFLPFEEARAYARTLGLRTSMDWYAWRDQRPANMPYSPYCTYYKQWDGWHDFLVGGERWFTFEEAKAYVRTLNFKSVRDWEAWRPQRPLNMPSMPRTIYKKQWVSWTDFLHLPSRFLPFEEARARVQALKLQGCIAWSEWSSSAQRPRCIPARPDRTYKEQWVSWNDWLG